MNAFQFGQKVANNLLGGPVPTPPSWDPKAPPPAMPPTDSYDVPLQTELSPDYWNARNKWVSDHNPRINQILQQRGVKLNDSAEHNQIYREQERRMYEQEKAQAEYWQRKNQRPVAPPVAAQPPAANSGSMTIQQRLNALNAERRRAGGEVASGPGVVKQVDQAFARGAKSVSPFPSSAGAPVPVKPMPAQPTPTQNLGVKK